MAVANDQILTGRKFRKLIDETTRLWLRISFWTKACDVEFDDGETAETKVTNITKTINNLTKSFQDGVNKIYNFLKGLGFTPSPNNPDGICSAIQKIYDDRYNDGRTQGREDVKENPSKYGVSTTPKSFNLNPGGIWSYTCPSTNKYTITVMFDYENNQGHNALGNHVILNIDNEEITIMRYRYSSTNNNFVCEKNEGVVNNTYTITRTLNAGAVVSLDVSEGYTDIRGDEDLEITRTQAAICIS